VGNCDDEDLIRGMLIDQAARISPKADVTMVGVVSREQGGVGLDEIQGSFQLRFKPIRRLRTACLVPRQGVQVLRSGLRMEEGVNHQAAPDLVA
jgi:hypothetical protein